MRCSALLCAHADSDSKDSVIDAPTPTFFSFLPSLADVSVWTA
jgi:hypothetical protein